MIKILDYYRLKDPRLWLEFPEDHDYKEKLGPKLLFLIGIDWWIGRTRPMFTPQQRLLKSVGIYYKTLNITFYLTYWQFHASFNIGKMPYTTHDEYLTWRRGQSDNKRNS